MTEIKTLGDVTVGIKTFYREKKLANCLDSLTGKGLAEVIVADDGKPSEKKQRIYEKYSKQLPLKVIELEFDSGLAYGRNQISKACSSEFLLMLDDDQTIPGNITDLKTILLHDKQLGGVSGFLYEHHQYKCDAHNLYIKNKVLFKDILQPPKAMETAHLTYFVLDQIPNSTLFRTECLHDSPWDNFYKIGREHVDFYLTHKIKGKWRFAVTPNVIISHFPSREGRYGKEFRLNDNRLEKSYQYFLEKWNLRGIVEGRKLLWPHRNIATRIRELLLSSNTPATLILFYEELYTQSKKVIKNFIKV